MIASVQKRLKYFSGLLLFASARQSVQAPKSANIKGGLWDAKVVGGLVTHHERPSAQYLFHLRHCGKEPRILPVDEAEFAHQQNAGVEMLTAKAFDESFAFI